MRRDIRTRDEIHSDAARRAERLGRETNHDKWTNMLTSAVEKCGFRIVASSGGMKKIIDPDYKEVVAHVPKHVTSKRVMQAVISDCGIPSSFVMQ